MKEEKILWLIRLVKQKRVISCYGTHGEAVAKAEALKEPGEEYIIL